MTNVDDISRRIHRRRINKGTLVRVSPAPPGTGRSSSGGIGIVRKKKRRVVSPDGTEEVLTQQSTASGSTAGVSLYDVFYTVDNRLSQEVTRERIDVANLATTARRRDPEDETRPSLLSTSHQPSDKHPTPRQVRRKTRHIKYSYRWLMGNRNKYHKGIPLVLYSLKRREKSASKGWLRVMESTAPVNLRSQLTEAERKQAMDLVAACAPSDEGARLVAYAFGKTAASIRKSLRNMIKNNGSLARKQRADTGTTVITSQKKRESEYTAKSVFAKLLRKQHGDTKLSAAEIQDQWASASAETRTTCDRIAKEWLERGPFLQDELVKALKKTAGAVSWQTLATLLAGNGPEPVSAATIRRYFMSLPDSTYKSTRILPKLDKANKQRRLNWSMEFWVFWESAIRFSSVQMVLVHMDEKWFYVIVVRRNLKSIPQFNIEPVSHAVQHKSHIGKTMGIASTAFVPFNNDVSKGGKAYLVSLTRVGRVVRASKNTYKRRYNEDGVTYSYPKDENNILRREGQEYFQNLEITGSKTTGKGRNGKNVPKFSLLDWFKNVEIPRLNELACRIGAESGGKVCIRYQMDSAGPHVDAKLLRYLDAEFSARGWIMKPQPSNSPITNVSDDSLFPMLSKLVSKEQGLHNGSQLFRDEDELWKTVEKCWNALPLDALARAYVRNSQIASAIYLSNGGDDFVRERNGLHCNVRKTCVTIYNDNSEPVGVEMAASYDPDTPEPQLRYAKPPLPWNTVKDTIGQLNNHEIDVMFDQFDYTDPWFDPVSDRVNQNMFESLGEEGYNSMISQVIEDTLAEMDEEEAGMV